MALVSLLILRISNVWTTTTGSLSICHFCLNKMDFSSVIGKSGGLIQEETRNIWEMWTLWWGTRKFPGSFLNYSTRGRLPLSWSFIQQRYWLVASSLSKLSHMTAITIYQGLLPLLSTNIPSTCHDKRDRCPRPQSLSRLWSRRKDVPGPWQSRALQFPHSTLFSLQLELWPVDLSSSKT